MCFCTKCIEFLTFRLHSEFILWNFQKRFDPNDWIEHLKLKRNVFPEIFWNLYQYRSKFSNRFIRAIWKRWIFPELVHEYQNFKYISILIWPSTVRLPPIHNAEKWKWYHYNAIRHSNELKKLYKIKAMKRYFRLMNHCFYIYILSIKLLIY